MADIAMPPSEAPPPLHKLKLWQALILYPALASAILAGIPTVWNEVKAWKLGVASSKLQLVEEQQQLWERNLPCIERQGTYEIDGPGGLVVKVTLCSTGDALLRYHQQDWSPYYKWVARPVIKEPK